MVEYEVWLKSSETALHLLKQKKVDQPSPWFPDLLSRLKNISWILHRHLWYMLDLLRCAAALSLILEKMMHIVGSQILRAGLVGSDNFVGANQKCVVFNGLGACLLSWWDTQLTLHRSGHVHQILLSLYSLHNILQLNSGERIHSAKACKCQIKMMRHLLTS